MQADWSHYVESIYFPDTALSFTALPARAKGFDSSYWNHGPKDNQKPIDFQAAYDAGYSFWIGRLTRGQNYIDTWIERDYIAASQTPLIKCVYHVLYPGESVGPHIDNLRRGLALLTEEPLGIGLDLEQGAEHGAGAVTSCLVDTVNAIRTFWTRKLLLYTNFNYLRNYILNLYGLDLWIAYPDDEPTSVNWTIWQKSWTQAIPGLPDKTVDLDEFNGDEVQCFQYFNAFEPPEPEPEPEDEMPDITLVKTARDLLNQYIAQAEGEPPAPPPPAPPNVKTYKVKPFEGDPKAPARFICYWNTNKKGVKVPVFAIYPSDSSKSDERQIFKLGDKVQIEGGELKGDGGLVCLKLYDPESQYKFQPLYMRLLDLEG